MNRTALGGFFIIGVIVGAIGWSYFHAHECSQYPYLNPDFSCDKAQVITKGGYLTLVNDLQNFFATKRSSGEASEAAVFFRDLEGGPTFNINANIPFIPASLLKLPVAFAFLRYAEEHPEILEAKITYAPENIHFLTVADAVEKSYTPLTIGAAHTVQQLLQNTLVYSDNLAFYLLIEHFNLNVPDGSTEITRVFQDLGIIDPRSPGEQVVTVRNYASLFRQLYNVSYLSKQDSEMVLSWLVDSSYDKALRVGVPSEIEIAHKFGERGLPDGSKQLHDCGIIYYPGNPYELCVMTRGDDWAELRAVIAEVSRIVYEEVNSRRL